MKDTLLTGSQYWYPDADSTLRKIACYVTDDEELLDTSFEGTVEISVEGAGQDESYTMDLIEGGVVIDDICGGDACSRITARVVGLDSATLSLGDPTGIADKEVKDPSEKLRLHNSPNPIDQITSIHFTLSTEARIRLFIVDMVGAQVATLIDGTRDQGPHSVTWDARGNKPGIYSCYLVTGNCIQVHKMLVVR
jgi:hypothetical protein